METFTLLNGIRVPKIGFGTYRTATGDDERVLLDAIAAGYRYFDTASAYDTEAALGKAIRKSGLPRSDFFIASKLWRHEMGYDKAIAALTQSLDRLGMAYVDLYLIHWPRPDMTCDWRTLDRETWRALEELQMQGKTMAIGLSNFLPHHIENLGETMRIRPVVNQIEFHPGYTQPETVAYCKTHTILVQAWSPLGRGRVLENPVVTSLAGKYGVTAAQICLRYALQKDIMPLPKASSLARMQQNLDVFHFTLSQGELDRLDTMPETGWSGQHPDQEP